MVISARRNKSHQSTRKYQANSSERERHRERDNTLPEDRRRASDKYTGAYGVGRQV